MNGRPHLLVALVLALAAAPSRAAAARSVRSTPRNGTEMLSLWGVVDPGAISGVGVGARVMMPAAPQGVLHARIRDELTLELGADYLHYEDRVGVEPNYVRYAWNGFLPVVGGTWNFWLTRDLAIYPKLDLGWWLGWYSGWTSYYGYSHAAFGGVFVQGAVGVVYRVKDVSLRLEGGSNLLRFGIGLPL